MKLQRLIEQHWQQPKPWLTILLKPFSYLFTKIAYYRRQAYFSGSLKQKKLPIPLIIIGNLHVGGTGKTPITAAIVKQLQQNGLAVGIISRGYGRTSQDIHILNPNSTSQQAGDEPLLLYRQTGAPTAVGSDRYQAGIALLAKNPQLQIMIADDGLQHYSLQRDLEICVFPASDVGKTHLDVLPNGVLREPLQRLHQVDFIVLSNDNQCVNTNSLSHYRRPIFRSQIQATSPYHHQTHQTWPPSSLKKPAHCIAMAAIARPERFFNSLKQFGININKTYALPDHASINIHALPPADYIFITEKDAVKLPTPAADNLWVLPIEAIIDTNLVALICKQLKLFRQPENRPSK